MKDYTYKNLRGSSFENENLVEADFSNADCSGASFVGANLFRANFKGAKLIDAAISFNCATFQGVKYDETQVKYLLYLITLADIDKDTRRAIKDVIGEKKYKSFCRLFGQRNAI